MAYMATVTDGSPFSIRWYVLVDTPIRLAITVIESACSFRSALMSWPNLAIDSRAGRGRDLATIDRINRIDI